MLSLIDTLSEPAESVEVRMNLLTDDFVTYGGGVLVDLAAYAKEQGWAVETPNFEGMRVSFPADSGDGWFLLRMSLHDPLMPLNIESNSLGGVKKIAAQLYAFLKRYDRLETDKLRAIV